MFQELKEGKQDVTKEYQHLTKVIPLTLRSLVVMVMRMRNMMDSG